jgi:hypothetical protein
MRSTARRLAMSGGLVEVAAAGVGVMAAEVLAVVSACGGGRSAGCLHLTRAARPREDVAAAQSQRHRDRKQRHRFDIAFMAVSLICGPSFFLSFPNLQGRLRGVRVRDRRRWILQLARINFTGWLGWIGI